MAFLEKYKAVEVERAPGQDALERAKRKMIAAIKQQIENAKNPGQLNGRGKPIRDWSFRDDAGNLYTHIRFGTRPIEFSTGKAFPMASPEELIPFYKDVIQAIESGELDDIVDRARTIGARKHGRRHGTHGGPAGRRHGRSGRRGNRDQS
ncbi:MAG: hypothetical protein QF393_21350 [Rhodospirillales bacterium]|nr:hypothetical protein [Rhodospirillales bacterium]